MARSRNIKPGFFLNEHLVELPFEYRLLFAGLWTLVDRDGRMEYRPKKIKMAIFPADNVDVENGLISLSNCNLIKIYENKKNKYIQVVNFDKHQNPHINEKSTNMPPPRGKNSGASTMQGPDSSRCNPADSLLPITDSFNPDSCTPIPDGRFPNVSGAVAPSSISTEINQHVKEVFEYWQTMFDKSKTKLTEDRRTKIRGRLKTHSVEELKSAIDGCAGSRHHMGYNDSKKIYNSIDLIFRNAGKVDEFIDIHETNANQQDQYEGWINAE